MQCCEHHFRMEETCRKREDLPGKMSGLVVSIDWRRNLGEMSASASIAGKNVRIEPGKMSGFHWEKRQDRRSVYRGKRQD